MSTPFVGEIRMFAGNFPPQGWAFCDGQILSIAENTVLFALVGTTYGGDGESTFALPDLRSRAPVHQGPGYVQGQVGGAETVTLTTAQMPPHVHALLASTAPASATKGPTDALGSSTAMRLYGSAAPNMAMAAASIGAAGGDQPHENMPPFVAVNFIIALFGVFPTQN
jgi:microcystin-dependent protein